MNILKIKRTTKQIFFVFILIIILVLPYFVFAQNPALKGLTDVQPGSGYAQSSEYVLAETMGHGVNAALRFLGIIFIGLMLYGGYNWMSASGDEQKLNRAKDTIRRAIIGIVIVVSSFTIWRFIVEKLLGYS